jgi:bis(5'-nucleosyl)-tetraphosphatase (symmetrical)
MATTGRRIFIGDVQGCADELKRLVERVRFDPAADRLFSVGDLVNRGPLSAESVRTVMALSGVAVMGNHEHHLFEKKSRALPADLQAAADRDQLVAWLRRMPAMVVQPDLIMVHAGFSPRWDASRPEAVAARLNAAIADPEQLDRDPDVRFAVSVRYCDPDGNLTRADHPPPPAPFRPWDEFYRGERMVVFGHWARRGLVLGRKVRGLDTGCVYGKSLTAWIAEEDRIVQVPAARAYCPIGD